MSLMYEVAAVNAAMIQAAEVCRQGMPEGDKVNAVLACFAGMKPVEAELVVHARWIEKPFLLGTTNACSRCGDYFGMPHGKFKFCPNCGSCMDAKGAEK